MKYSISIVLLIITSCTEHYEPIKMYDESNANNSFNIKVKFFCFNGVKYIYSYNSGHMILMRDEFDHPVKCKVSE